MADEPLEWDALSLAARAELARNAPGPDLSREHCACGSFGPWSDGTFFYCERHVPPDLRYRAQFFAEMME